MLQMLCHSNCLWNQDVLLAFVAAFAKACVSSEHTIPLPTPMLRVLKAEITLA